MGVTYIANTYMMGKWLAFVRLITCCRRGAPADDSIAELVLAAIEDLTGIRPELSDPLQDTGLASLGIATLVSTLNANTMLHLTAALLVGCNTVGDVVSAVHGNQEK